MNRKCITIRNAIDSIARRTEGTAHDRFIPVAPAKRRAMRERARSRCPAKRGQCQKYSFPLPSEARAMPEILIPVAQRSEGNAPETLTDFPHTCCRPRLHRNALPASSHARDFSSRQGRTEARAEVCWCTPHKRGAVQRRRGGKDPRECRGLNGGAAGESLQGEGGEYREPEGVRRNVRIEFGE